jgi:hypothetical protein
MSFTIALLLNNIRHYSHVAGEGQSMRHSRVILLFSIVILGLLATFILTGLMQERTLVPETLETVRWSKEVMTNNTGPAFYFNEPIGKPVLSDSLYFDPAVDMYQYCFSGNGDYVYSAMKINTTTTQGFVENVFIRLNCSQSTVQWVTAGFDSKNLVLENCRSGKSAYVQLTSVNQAVDACFRGGIIWCVLSEAQTIGLDATIEVAYFNGTFHKKMIQPFQLSIHVCPVG